MEPALSVEARDVSVNPHIPIQHSCNCCDNCTITCCCFPFRRKKKQQSHANRQNESNKADQIAKEQFNKTEKK